MAATDDAKTDAAPAHEAAAGAGADADAPARVHLDILETLKLAQTQHGLRQATGEDRQQFLNDYMRYRQYCARRLRRIRRGLKVTHGRREFKKRAVDTAKVLASGDERHLELSLMAVERAWAHSMELKEEETEDNLRPGVHHRRRLAKAARNGDLFVALCREVADARTQLEAEAYAGWMHGQNHLERGELVLALTRFKNARGVFGELAKVSSVEQQALCRERMQQMEPSIRLIEYDLAKLKRQGVKFSAEDEAELLKLQEDAVGDEVLQGRLEALLADGRKADSEALSSVLWGAQRVPVRNEKVRDALLQAQQQTARAEGKGAAGGDLAHRMELYSGVLGAYEDALVAARADVAEADKHLVKKQAMEHLEAVEAYVVHAKLVTTDRRNRAMAASLAAQYAEQQAAAMGAVGAAAGAAAPSGGPSRKKVKAEDLVHLLERMAQNVEAASKAAPPGADGAELEARRAAYAATRCFFLAESYRAVGRHPEAYCLLARAAEKAAAAAALPGAGADVAAEMGDLGERASAQQYVVQVEHLQGKAGAGGARTRRKRRKGDTRTLEERIDEYDEGPPDAAHRLLDFPPGYVPVQAKPVFFDLAFNYVDYPDISGRFTEASAPKEEESKASGGGGGGGGGWFGGLWGR